MAIDKRCIQQVLGCLIQRPQFLSEVDKYSLDITDFSSKFEKFIFSAINGLYRSGASKIAIADIENFLSTNEIAASTFTQNNGIEYLQDIINISTVDNFSFYYNRLKKFNLLRDLQRKGIDTSSFYIDDLTNPQAFEVNEKFEDLTIQDIINEEKKTLAKLESSYVISDEVETWTVADEIDNIVDGFGSADNIGYPIQGTIFNHIINGAERGALTIRSGSSGLGKTRRAVADACFLAYPVRYNISKCKWEVNGSNQKVLFIATEQKYEQVMKMIVAYLTGINESKFKAGIFTEDEKLRISQAKDIIKAYKKNFILVRVPNPTIDLIKTIVREQCLMNDIDIVFYDYIFIGPALLNEFRGFNIRQDEALLMFATALKDLAVELNVSVFTSTQVNAKADENRDIRNEASLAGGRATINKADNGCIMARPTNDELDILYKDKAMPIKPNIVTDVFKVRSGQWTQVRVWSYFDGGTLRNQDLLLTDSQLNPINDFFRDGFISFDSDDNCEALGFVNILNEGLENL